MLLISKEEEARRLQMAEQLRKELEPMVLGQSWGPWQCSCGALHYGECVATEINVPTMHSGWEDDIAYPPLWTAQMSPIDGNDSHRHGYSLSLSEFIPQGELQAMFRRHFPGINPR